MSAPFSVKKRFHSFTYAIKGIGTLLRSEHNAWIHLVATSAVIGAGVFFHVSKTKWLFLVVAVAMVWCAEAFNTAIELLCDHVSQEHQPLIGKSKDVAAGAVLIAAMAATVIGLIIFVPHLHF
jgi:diacylglycerol kinase (ATP)